MEIIDLNPKDDEVIRQIAEILVLAFKKHWPNAWPDLASALQEVNEFVAEDRVCRIAVGEDGRALGWIGGIPEYQGHAWQLHPLAVHPQHQGRGIGRALVRDLEEIVHNHRGTTIYLGTDDEDRMTSLSQIDLYPNVLEHIANIQNLRGHPFSFYQKLGFVIVGVIPDANGPGKPDIIMAKRVAS